MRNNKKKEEKLIVFYLIERNELKLLCFDTST